MAIGSSVALLHSAGMTAADLAEAMFNQFKALGYDMSKEGQVGKTVRDIAWTYGVQLNDEGIRI